MQGILLASSSLQTDSPTPPPSHQLLLPASSSSGGGGSQHHRRQSSSQRAPYAESESISSKHTSVLVSYWTCLTERISSLICKCCERTLPPVESV